VVVGLAVVGVVEDDARTVELVGTGLVVVARLVVEGSSGSVPAKLELDPSSVAGGSPSSLGRETRTVVVGPEASAAGPGSPIMVRATAATPSRATTVAATTVRLLTSVEPSPLGGRAG
jgi:hypothetical protein